MPAEFWKMPVGALNEIRSLVVMKGGYLMRNIHYPELLISGEQSAFYGTNQVVPGSYIGCEGYNGHGRASEMK